MLERVNPVLKIVCLGFAALLLFQLSRLAIWKNPLADVVIPSVTSAPATAASTNLTAAGVAATNAVATNAASTNAASARRGSTNVAPGSAASDAAAVTPALAKGRKGMNARMGSGPELKEADLPAAIQTRVEKVIQSEILGAVMKPPPMALLGIAGKDVFLRAPNGQSGLIREGDELGGVKLLKIGANRVLIEVEGQKKELTIFEGLGSETLLPK